MPRLNSHDRGRRRGQGRQHQHLPAHTGTSPSIENTSFLPGFGPLLAVQDTFRLLSQSSPPQEAQTTIGTDQNPQTRAQAIKTITAPVFFGAETQDQAYGAFSPSLDPTSQAYYNPFLQQQPVRASQLAAYRFTPEEIKLRQRIFAMPEELRREPTGSSVLEAGSILEASGRTYQSYKEGKYWLPNDPAEQDRLDLQHATVMILLDGQLACAPIQSPKNMLDVATGTGIWALEYARQNPECHVVATDLSSIQPPNTPPNFEFIKEDSEEDWVFPQVKFDYVHLRWCFLCFNDTKKVIKNAFDNLEEGGWIEFQDGTCVSDSKQPGYKETPAYLWGSVGAQGAAKMGRDVLVSQRYKDWLLEAGFVDVVEQKYKLPVGTWPRDPHAREVGKFFRENFIQGTRAFALKMIGAMGWSSEDIERLVRDVKMQARENRWEAWFDFWVVYGRKPYQNERARAAPSSRQES